MNKTKIEWVKNPDGSPGYTWNPITGCLNHIDGMCKGGNFPCWAYGLAHGRLKSRYQANSILPCHDEPGYLSHLKHHLDPFYPRFWPQKLTQLGNAWDPRTWHKKVKGIFVCNMSDLFGIGIPEEWTRRVLAELSDTPHRFYLLTKQPQNLAKFSPFPDNCWVGVTATNPTMLIEAKHYLSEIEAQIKYVSLEPFLNWSIHRELDWLVEVLESINQVIIGALTGTMQDLLPVHHRTGLMMVRQNGNRWSLQPQIEWVNEIVVACDKAGIPVFLKDNLFKTPRLSCAGAMPFYKREASGTMELRQELPK